MEYYGGMKEKKKNHPVKGIGEDVQDKQLLGE